MDTISLCLILERLKLHEVKVLAADQFITEMIRGTKGLFIVNNQPSTESGEHWLAISTIGDTNEFFDSFGNNAAYYNSDFAIYLHPYIYNRRCLQGSKTVVCWAYCIFYLQKRVSGMTLECIASLFSDDVFRNDNEIVKRL